MSFQRQGFCVLQNDPNLRQFILQDVTFTGKQLGTGSYGTVHEMEFCGLECAGKTFHEILLEGGNDGAENMAQKYFAECQLMASLRHPNVTQFLGLCFLPPAALPVLVMEKLEQNLDNFLETTPNIPLALKRSILEDVARGLLYLHRRDPPIIHRDLTARNVLLTSSFAAKITDLSNSRIVNLQHGQLARTLSRLPGTLTYMPPEALSMASRYGPSLDIFSFGHLGLYTGLQVFPGDLLEHTYPDTCNPDRLLGHSEEERRGVYFDQLAKLLPKGEQHPLIQLLKQCLHNTPSRRPTAEEVLRRLKEMKEEIEGPEGSVLSPGWLITLMQSESELKKKDDEIARLQQKLERRHQRGSVSKKKSNLRKEIDRLKSEKYTLKTELQRCREDLEKEKEKTKAEDLEREKAKMEDKYKKELDREKAKTQELLEKLLVLSGQRQGHRAPGAEGHDTLASNYDNLFKHFGKDAATFLSSKFDPKHKSMATTKVRELIGKIFYDIYETSKDAVLGSIFEDVFQPLAREIESGQPIESTKDRASVFGTCVANTPALIPETKEQKQLRDRVSKKIHEKYRLEALIDAVSGSKPAPDDTHKVESVTKWAGSHESEFRLFLDKAIELAWKMVTIQPPMIITFPEGELDPEVHEKDSLPSENSDMVFFRPALYRNFKFSKPEVKAEVGFRCKKRVDSIATKTGSK